MSNRELPMMPWFPDQFAASTAGWSFMERAVYRALLDLQWQQGHIYEDLRRICCATGVDLRTLQRCWRVVGQKFATVDGGLKNFRLEQHRLAALELRRKKSAGGRSRQAQLRAVHEESSRTPAGVLKQVLQDASSISSPSPSLREEEDLSLPLPSPAAEQREKGALPKTNGGTRARSTNPRALGTNPVALGTNPKALGTNPRALGTNPKARGTNPRALGTNPRALGTNRRAARRTSAQAWNQVLTAAQQGLSSAGDETVDEAVRQIGGFTRLSQAHVAERSANRDRFRDAYETLLDKSAQAHDDDGEALPF